MEAVKAAFALASLHPYAGHIFMSRITACGGDVLGVIKEMSYELGERLRKRVNTPKQGLTFFSNLEGPMLQGVRRIPLFFGISSAGCAGLGCRWVDGSSAAHRPHTYPKNSIIVE